jgi:hypothetical protein
MLPLVWFVDPITPKARLVADPPWCDAYPRLQLDAAEIRAEFEAEVVDMPKISQYAPADRDVANGISRNREPEKFVKIWLVENDIFVFATVYCVLDVKAAPSACPQNDCV